MPAPLTPADLAGVDSSPLPGSAANFRTTALREPDARRLRVGPSLALRVAAVALVGCGLGVPAALLAKEGWAGAAGLIGMAAFFQVFTVAGVVFWVSPKRVEFDIDAGVARVRSFRARTEFPLSDVAAVQVADGGLHRTSKGGSYRTYQLNLVLSGTDPSRLGLSNHAGRAWTYEAGRRISEFLAVPLLDPAGAAPADSDSPA